MLRTCSSTVRGQPCRQRGSVIAITLMLIVIISVGSIIALRSSRTFTRVTSLFRAKQQASAIAEIGAERAAQEVRRRFSKMVNPESTTPLGNGQYRVMPLDDAAAVMPILEAYAADLFTISSPTCTESSLSTDYGGDVTDIPICLNDDPSGDFEYEVTLKNRDDIGRCRNISDGGSGYLSVDCESKLVSQTCLLAASTASPAYGTWDDDSCKAPESFHFGDLDGPPELGFNLTFESKATDSAGRSATVEVDVKIFIRRDADFTLAARAFNVDGRTLAQGGVARGQIRIILPQHYFESKLFGYVVPTGVPGVDSSDYYFGRAYGYTAKAHDGSSPPFIDTILPAYYSGIRIQEIVTNMGVANALKDNAIIDPANIHEFVAPDHKGDYESVLGSTNDFVAVENGAFDEQMLLDKITTFYNDYNSAINPTLRTSGGSGDVMLINDGTTDGFSAVSSITNNLSGRNDRSMIIGGNLELDGGSTGVEGGAVYVDGDLIILPDTVVEGVGTIIARRNVKILGNVGLRNYPSGGNHDDTVLAMSDVSGPPFDYAASPGTKDALRIIAGGHITLGNDTHAQKISHEGTGVSASATQMALDVPPLDGFSPQSYGSDFEPALARNDPSMYGSDYARLLQVGFRDAADTLAFPSEVTNPPNFPPGPLEHLNYSPPYEPLDPASTREVGLMVEGACSVYEDNPTARKHYRHHGFRNPASPVQLPGFGFSRPAGEYPDGPGRATPTCVGNPDCIPSAATGHAPLAGGVLSQGYWGVCPDGNNDSNRAWISPQAFHTLFFSEPGQLEVGGNDASTAGSAGQLTSTDGDVPGIGANTYDTLSDVNHDSYVSKVQYVDADLIAGGWVTGIGGDDTFNVWDGVTTPKPAFDGTSGQVDHDDVDTSNFPNYYDNDGNGVTFRTVNGNYLVRAQGGNFFFSTNYRQSVLPENRVTIVTRVEKR